MSSTPQSAIENQSSAGPVKSNRLPHPVRITEQVWPEGTVPVVSIFCITYNHVNFIRDAIEGFLMQETTFPVGIFIHDDASTDGTAEIVKDYAGQFPKFFLTVLQTENQWSKGNKQIFFDYLAKQKGKFIALCEGDDYWIAKEKLQKQVEVLEGDPAVSFVFHKAFEELLENQDRSVLSAEFRGQRFQISDMFKYSFAVPTASMLLRAAWFSNPDWLSGCLCGDRALQLILLNKGPAAFIDETWSLYRTHGGGLTRAISKNYATTVIPNWIAMYYGFNETTEDRHGSLIHKEICRLVGERCRFQIYAMRAEQTSFRGDAMPPETMQSPNQCRLAIVSLLEDTAACLREPNKGWFLQSAVYRETKSEALVSAGDAWYVRKQFGKAREFYKAAMQEGQLRARLYCGLLCIGSLGRALRSLIHRVSLAWQRMKTKGA